MKCEICEKEARFRWTDNHGIGACWNCGAPYRLYHYDREGPKAERVDKPPELLILPMWRPILKRYWQETGRNCSPGAFNFPGSSYEVANEVDFETFDAWIEAHKSELPHEDTPDER